MLLALLGGVVQTGGYALVSNLGLPLWVLYITNAVAGCSGGFCMFLMAIFASCVHAFCTHITVTE